jgi:microcystin-dependent protein
MTTYIGEIRAVAFSFAPKGWAFCHGQLLSIEQNKSLFSLLGTTFGGDGETTFGLPDYRDRAPVGMGAGPGLKNITQGEQGGSAATVLTPQQCPKHTHAATGRIRVFAGTTQALTPYNTIKAEVAAHESGSPLPAYAPSEAAEGHMAPEAMTVSVQPAGGARPVPLMNPFLGTNFIISTQGVFPPRG